MRITSSLRDWFVGLAENIRLAGVQLPIHTLDDIIPKLCVRPTSQSVDGAAVDPCVPVHNAPINPDLFIYDSLGNHFGAMVSASTLKQNASTSTGFFLYFMIFTSLTF